jgi:hypothetical protein
MQTERRRAEISRMGFTVSDNLPDLFRELAAGGTLTVEPGRRFLCARWISSAIEDEPNFDAQHEASSLPEGLRLFAKLALDEFGFSSDLREWADFGLLAKARTRVVQRWPELASLDDDLLIAFASLAVDDLEFAAPGAASEYSSFFPDFVIAGWEPVLGLFASPPSEAGWVLFQSTTTTPALR